MTEHDKERKRGRASHNDDEVMKAKVSARKAALRVINNDADADDAYSEAVLIYYQYLSKGKQIHNPIGFIVLVAKRAAVNKCRALANLPLLSFDEITDSCCGGPRASVEDVFQSLETLELVSLIAAQLPPTTTKIFLAKAQGKKSFREIADEMGIPRSTVEGKYRKAIQALKASPALREAHKSLVESGQTN